MPFIHKLIRFGEAVISNYGLSEVAKAPAKVKEFESFRDPDGLPAKVDLRLYCTEVEDQASSNSCCANAVAGAYEYLCKREAMRTGDEAGDVSRLFIYFVGRKSDQSNPNQRVKDEGMTIGGAITALQQKGAPLADSWPFDLEHVNARPPPEAFDEAMGYKISEGLHIPVDAQTMRQCLADGYPFVFGLKLTKRFFSPGRSGIIKTPNLDDPQSASHGLHAMLCVGYSDTDQVFIVRNSWGASWGHNGYCYIPYEYMANEDFNFCGQYAIQGLTNYDLTPDWDMDEEQVVNEEDDDGEDEPEVEQEEGEEQEDEDSENEYDDLFDAEAEARRVFNYFDQDQSGNMGNKELRKALKYMGLKIDKKTAKMLKRHFDADGDGKLDFDEFLKIIEFTEQYMPTEEDEDSDCEEA